MLSASFKSFSTSQHPTVDRGATYTIAVSREAQTRRPTRRCQGGAVDVHLVLPVRVLRVALCARALAGAQPKRLVLELLQPQVAQGALGFAHFARLEGAVVQDPLMLDAAPPAPGQW